MQHAMNDPWGIILTNLSARVQRDAAETVAEVHAKMEYLGVDLRMIQELDKPHSQDLWRYEAALDLWWEVKTEVIPALTYLKELDRTMGKIQLIAYMANRTPINHYARRFMDNCIFELEQYVDERDRLMDVESD